MLNIIRFLAVLIAVVVLPPQSYSQTPGNRLEGITGVRIIGVVDDDEDARTCGITGKDLQSAAAFPVATSALSLSDAGPAFLVVNVVVSRLSNGGCSASYAVEVSVIQWATLEATNLSKLVEIRLWDSSGLMLAPPDTFGGQLRATIETLAKMFVVDWTLDQQ